MSAATAISVYHCGGSAAEFARWVACLDGSAGAAPGYLERRVATRRIAL